MKDRRRYIKRVNYLRQQNKRRKLTHYLKAGGFRKIAGSKLLGYRMRRNRRILAGVFILIILAGLYGIFS